MNNKILTNREQEVFELSEKTVRNHISNVIQKLGVKGRSQAIIELIKSDKIKI